MTEPSAVLRAAFERVVPLPDDVWDELRQLFHLREVQAGQVLTREGEAERAFGVVMEGSQRLYFTARDGDRVTVAFARAGDYTGVPDAYFLDQPSGYTLEALTDGAVLTADRDAFLPLLERHRALERWAWRLFLTVGAGRAKREREMLTLSAAERVDRLMRETPDLLLDVPLRHVASYLGMTPETLSRVRAGRT